MSLVIDDLVVRYGGRTALSGLNLNAPLGAVTGLVGSNGAGKSSALGAIGGQVAIESGTVSLSGVTLNGLSPWRRAGHGLGRSFQRASVFPGLTVRDDVGLGWEAPRVGSNAVRLIASRGQAAERAAAVDHALAILDIEDLADRMTATLSLGDRRRVELARCIAGGRRMLLLDEPSCNLDGNERNVVATALLTIVATTGIGVVMVDHDLPLIASVCDQVVVLDQGRVIFTGDPSGFSTDVAVRGAFLGGAI